MKAKLIGMLSSHKFWAVVVGLVFIFASNIPFLKGFVKPITPVQFNALVLVLVGFIISLK